MWAHFGQTPNRKLGPVGEDRMELTFSTSRLLLCIARQVNGKYFPRTKIDHCCSPGNMMLRFCYLYASSFSPGCALDLVAFFTLCLSLHVGIKYEILQQAPLKRSTLTQVSIVTTARAQTAEWFEFACRSPNLFRMARKKRTSDVSAAHIKADNLCLRCLTKVVMCVISVIPTEWKTKWCQN